MAFEPGSFVVCVDDRHPYEQGRLTQFGRWDTEASAMDGLCKGTVYTVRASGVSCLQEPTVWLAEIVRPIRPGFGEEAGYHAARFRPLKDSALSVFREALEPSPKQTEAA